MASLSQGCVLKQEGQIEEEELTKKTEKGAERKVANVVNLAFPLSFPVPSPTTENGGAKEKNV